MKQLSAPLLSATLAVALSSCASLSKRPTAIDADAELVLSKASATLAAAESYSFRIQRDVPAALAEAAGIRGKADIRVSAVRPNRVAAVRGSGTSEARFYYDGSSITLYDAGTNSYAAAEAPATTDEMIQQLDEQWGIRPPLAGMLVSTPFASRGIKSTKGGELVGTEEIAGEPCDHLKILGDGVQWDLWISKRDYLPRRFDVTVTELEGSPRGVTTISEWNTDANLSPNLFEANIPAGATRREMSEMP